jgi:hypothetical protein
MTTETEATAVLASTSTLTFPDGSQLLLSRFSDGTVTVDQRRDRGSVWRPVDVAVSEERFYAIHCALCAEQFSRPADFLVHLTDEHAVA